MSIAEFVGEVVEGAKVKRYGMFSGSSSCGGPLACKYRGCAMK